MPAPVSIHVLIVAILAAESAAIPEGMRTPQVAPLTLLYRTLFADIIGTTRTLLPPQPVGASVAVLPTRFMNAFASLDISSLPMVEPMPVA